MDYHNYTVEDFVLNVQFRKWILDPQKEDNLFWEAWLKKHPEKLNTIKTASKVLLMLPNVEYKLLHEEKHIVWEKILNDIEHENPEYRQKVLPINAETIIKKANGSQKPNTFQLKKLVAAASIILVLAVSFYFINNQFKTISTTNNIPERVVKETHLGQKLIFYLSDGTKAILNSDSKLAFNKEFDNDQREVILEGEAFFDVAEDKTKPFRVISKGLVITALGTSFNVKALQKQQEVNVSLVTGKVAVGSANNEFSDALILGPGEQVNYNEESKSIKKVPFDAKEVLSWKDGVIYFKNADSEEVFTYLEKWYGVEINVVNQSVKTWDYSGSFNNMDLENVLRAIGYSMNFEFKINDEKVMVKYFKD